MFNVCSPARAYLPRHPNPTSKSVVIFKASAKRRSGDINWALRAPRNRPERSAMISASDSCTHVQIALIFRATRDELCNVRCVCGGEGEGGSSLAYTLCKYAKQMRARGVRGQIVIHTRRTEP